MIPNWYIDVRGEFDEIEAIAQGTWHIAVEAGDGLVHEPEQHQPV